MELSKHNQTRQAAHIEVQRALAAERRRCATIVDLCVEHGTVHLASALILEGAPIEAVRSQVFEASRLLH